MSGPLKVHEIIESAIEDNRQRVGLLFGFAIVFVLLGSVVLVWGLIQDSFVAYAGVAESLLFVPAIHSVRRINHETAALRLLEIPLRRAKSADEAARILLRFFASAYGIGE